jgi:D-glycero-alpha-D-manno-heptose-7-phosphate kinase
MIVKSRAPLRLGFAGGGTDVSPYCDKFGGFVLNATIDKYAYCVIKKLENPIVKFSATDKQLEVELPLSNYYDLDGNLDLHKAVYNRIIHDFNAKVPISIEISTFSDVPAGSGLGSSSTLVVAMIKGFVELLNLPLDDYAIAHLAYSIERSDCGLQGGRQDQYSATFGGFNFMEFYAQDKVVITPLRVKKWILSELESSILLYYTGVSRESAKIIADQSKNMSLGSDEIIDTFHGIKQEAIQMKEALLKGDFNYFVESLKVGWENKKKSSTSVSNNFIDQIYDTAISYGARAGKVSGAGGGGFMLFFVPSTLRMNVIRSLSQFGGNISNAHFTNEGTQAWVSF